MRTVERLMVPSTARTLLRARPNGLMQKMMPKRSFNSKIDGFLERMLDNLPQRNIAYLIAGLNTFFYGLYVFWPKYSMHSYLNNFTFNMYGFNQGYVHSLITCHFSHQGFFQYLIDTLLIVLISQSVVMMEGPLFLAKTCLLSMFLGSFMLFFYHVSQQGLARPFQGNDAIWRGIVFSIIFQNPQTTFMLFPLPINLPAWGIGVFLLAMDFLTFNVPGFGGVGAAYLMTQYL